MTFAHPRVRGRFCTRYGAAIGPVQFLLWDFGDTLVDEHWMWVCPPGVPDWAEAWRRVLADDLRSAWDRGHASAREVAERVAAELPMSVEAVIDHMRRCCRGLAFFGSAWSAACERARPQALVTVNPDVFSDVVVTHYQLSAIFDVIVTAWQEAVVDKGDLCMRALDRLGGTQAGQALLIDNLERNVQAWRAYGGLAYWFRGDDLFGQHLSERGWDDLGTAE